MLTYIIIPLSLVKRHYQDVLVCQYHNYVHFTICEDKSIHFFFYTVVFASNNLDSLMIKPLMRLLLNNETPSYICYHIVCLRSCSSSSPILLQSLDAYRQGSYLIFFLLRLTAKTLLVLFNLKHIPKLEILLLVNLPNFKTICSTHTLAWSSLELLRIHNCPKLKTLPLDSDNAVNLKSIKGQQEWWDELEWTNNKVRPIFAASNEYFSQIFSFMHVTIPVKCEK